MPNIRDFTSALRQRPGVDAVLVLGKDGLLIEGFATPGLNTLPRRSDVTDQEKQKAEELISRLELSVGQIFPRDGGNAALLATMIQTLNGLRSLLGLVRPH